MSSVNGIIDRLAKIKTLAERGESGERTAAARLLEQITARYGVDLDDIGGDTESDHPLGSRFRGWKKNLVVQLLCLMRIEQYGDRNAEHCSAYRRTRRGRSEYFVRCTDAQYVELMAKFAVLARDYEKQRMAFYRAFLVANDLLAPAKPDGPEPTAREMEEAETAARVAQGIRRTSLHRQIEAGEEAPHA